MYRALALVVVYLLVGVASYQPVRRTLEDRCQRPPTSSAHVAVWPVSLLALWGLRSRC